MFCFLSPIKYICSLPCLQACVLFCAAFQSKPKSRAQHVLWIKARQGLTWEISANKTILANAGGGFWTCPKIWWPFMEDFKSVSSVCIWSRWNGSSVGGSGSTYSASAASTLFLPLNPLSKGRPLSLCTVLLNHWTVLHCWYALCSVHQNHPLPLSFSLSLLLGWTVLQSIMKRIELRCIPVLCWRTALLEH